MVNKVKIWGDVKFLANKNPDKTKAGKYPMKSLIDLKLKEDKKIL